MAVTLSKEARKAKRYWNVARFGKNLTPSRRELAYEKACIWWNCDTNIRAMSYAVSSIFKSVEAIGR